ncbi:hypothetical protein BKA93DRAFT_750753 [Sparassis latifolia]
MNAAAAGARMMRGSMAAGAVGGATGAAGGAAGGGTGGWVALAVRGAELAKGGARLGVGGGVFIMVGGARRAPPVREVAPVAVRGGWGGVVGGFLAPRSRARGHAWRCQLIGMEIKVERVRHGKGNTR